MKDSQPAGKCASEAKCAVKMSIVPSVGIDPFDSSDHKLELYIRCTDAFEGFFHCARVSKHRYNERGKEKCRSAQYFSDP